jgi:hypothetical protein
VTLTVPGWVGFFLGAIAAATVLMAIIQVGVIIYAGRLARRVERLTEEMEREIRPFIENLNGISDNAQKVSALALAQVERADRLLADLTQRVDQTFSTIQAAIITPAREGMAVVSAVRAVLGAFRDLRQSGRPRAAKFDDEDALFIG